MSTKKLEQCVYTGFYNIIDYYIPHDVPLIKTSLSNTAGYLFSTRIISNSKIRSHYNNEVAKIKYKYLAKVSSNEPITHEFAQELFSERNELKSLEKARMHLTELYIIYVRNWFKYSNCDGPDYEYLAQKKTADSIAKSAGTTGGQDMGLQSEMFLCIDRVLSEPEFSESEDSAHYSSQDYSSEYCNPLNSLANLIDEHISNLDHSG